MSKSILLTGALVLLIVAGVLAAHFLRNNKKESAPGEDFEILE